jgi:hypothetical protein
MLPAIIGLNLTMVVGHCSLSTRKLQRTGSRHAAKLPTEQRREHHIDADSRTEIFGAEVMTPRHSRHGQCMSPAVTLRGYVEVTTHPQSVFANHSAVMVIT